MFRYLSKVFYIYTRFILVKRAPEPYSLWKGLYMSVREQDATHVSLSKKQIIIVMIGLMLEVFTGSMSQLIIATAMPRIITDLGGFDQYTWVVTMYMMTSAIMMPIAGKISDMYGKKWFYIFGIMLFISSSALSGFSQSMTQLIIFRGIQGIGFGIMMTLGMVIMADLFPPSERGKYMGLINGVFGISAVIGPTLGGYLTDYFSWHWCFFVNVPFGILVIILMIIFFPEMPSESVRRKIDFPGIVIMILAIIPLMLALTWGGRQYEWLSMRIISMLLFSGIMLIFFLRIENHSPEALIPPEIFKNSIFTVSSICVFIQGVAFFSCLTFVPLFLQGVLGTSAMMSGNMLTPMMLGSVAGSIGSGQILSRAGGHYRTLAGIGFAVIGAGLLLLSQMTTETTFTQATLNMILVGLGGGIIMPLHMIAVQNAVPYSVLGSATAALNLVRSLGGIFGLAFYGSIMNTIFFSKFTRNIPEEITSVIGSDKLIQIAKNPQALVNSNAQSQLKTLFEIIGDKGNYLFSSMITSLQESLNSALMSIFTISFITVIIAFILNLYLKEIPLRNSVRGDEKEDSSKPMLKKSQEQI